MGHPEERKRRREQDAQGFPLPKKLSRRKSVSGESVAGSTGPRDETESQASSQASSWRSLASSRLTRERMTGGHIVPKLEEALKTGSVVYFHGQRSNANAGSPSPRTRNTSDVIAKVTGLSGSDSSAKPKPLDQLSGVGESESAIEEVYEGSKDDAERMEEDFVT